MPDSTGFDSNGLIPTVQRIEVIPSDGSEPFVVLAKIELETDKNKIQATRSVIKGYVMPGARSFIHFDIGVDMQHGPAGASCIAGGI